MRCIYLVCCCEYPLEPGRLPNPWPTEAPQMGPRVALEGSRQLQSTASVQGWWLRKRSMSVLADPTIRTPSERECPC